MKRLGIVFVIEFFLLILICLPKGQAEEIYTYTDKDGNTVLSNIRDPQKQKAKKNESSRRGSSSNIQQHQKERKESDKILEAEQRRKQQIIQGQKEAEERSKQQIKQAQQEAEQRRKQQIIQKQKEAEERSKQQIKQAQQEAEQRRRQQIIQKQKEAEERQEQTASQAKQKTEQLSKQQARQEQAKARRTGCEIVDFSQYERMIGIGDSIVARTCVDLVIRNNDSVERNLTSTGIVAVLKNDKSQNPEKFTAGIKPGGVYKGTACFGKYLSPISKLECKF
jgi:hypothetical protein